MKIVQIAIVVIVSYRCLVFSATKIDLAAAENYE
jgi:hypothetical protein